MPKHTDAAHSLCSSTSVHAGDTRGLGRLEDNTKVVRTDGQVSEGIEGVTDGEEAIRMSYAHLHPVQLTTTHRKLVTTPARTASSSMVSRLTSTVPHVPNSSVNLYQGPSIPLPVPYPSPHSFSEVIPQPSAHSFPSSTLRFTSAASQPSSTVSPSSTTSQPTTSLHPGPTMPLLHSIPLPHSFTNAISNHSARFPPNRQHPQHSTSTVPFRSLSTTRKRSSKTRTRRFGSLPVHSPATPPFQQRPVNFQSTYPTSDTFQPCQVNQWSLREPPLSIVVDIPDNTSSSGHDFPSVLPAIPSDDLNRPLNIALEPCLPQTHENRSNEVFTPSNHTITS